MVVCGPYPVAFFPAEELSLGPTKEVQQIEIEVSLINETWKEEPTPLVPGALLNVE